MKKVKTQKGITLVALIITIVVLLILAVVAINSVDDSGVIDKATQATDAYYQEQLKENIQLGNYTNIITEKLPTYKVSGTWKWNDMLSKPTSDISQAINFSGYYYIFIFTNSTMYYDDDTNPDDDLPEQPYNDGFWYSESAKTIRFR